MKCFQLSAHHKPISRVVFNKEGDLLFCSGKDKLITVWYSKTGKILGSYEATAAVFDIDVSYDSKYLIAGTGDGQANVFEVKTGKMICKYDFEIIGQVTCVKFDSTAKNFFAFTPRSKPNYFSRITVFRFNPNAENKKDICIPDKLFENNMDDESVTYGSWGVNDKTIIAGCSNGWIRKFHLSYKKELEMGFSSSVHDEKAGFIKDLKVSKDKAFVISASIDKTARLSKIEKLQVIKVFKSDEPVNSADISPIKNHVILGGGTRSQEVTLSKRKGDTFDALIYHSIFENELYSAKGHFGPIHCIRFSPDGKSFVTGGEDSIVKIYKFHQKYLNSSDSLEKYLKKGIDSIIS